MSVIEKTDRLLGGLGRGEPKACVCLYDFAVDGGAVGDIALRGDVLPSGAVIVDSLIRVETVLTSGGAATVAIKTEGTADVNAADAISGAPWSTTGAKRGDLTSTTAPVTTTAVRTPTATVGTAALTAGKFTLVIWYLEF